MSVKQTKRKEALGDKTVKFIAKDITWVPIDRITPYDNNPKLHPPEQVKLIAESIEAAGWDQPIVVDKDYTIIKGHGRRLAALMLGLKEVPIVVREDLTPAQAKASRIADNQTAESFWHMGSLIREFEALYGDEIDLTRTGFSLKEVRTMSPGLIETDLDFAVDASDGEIPSLSLHRGMDGFVGDPISKTGTKDTLAQWVAKHDTIIVPFTGDRVQLGVIAWAKINNLPPEKVLLADVGFGPRMWRWHQEYLEYVSKETGFQILPDLDNKMEDWHSLIESRGWPTRDSNWCCNNLRLANLRAALARFSKSSVVLFGATKPTKDGAPKYRQRGTIEEQGIRYAAPFFDKPDSILLEVALEAGIKLNPLYQVCDIYMCPGCPNYSKPDFAFLREHDLDLWIRWMVYFGRSHECSAYVDSGQFSDQALEMIADGIEPREEGLYRGYALPLPECSQPVRNYVAEGDDYGWDPEQDRKREDSIRLDKPRGPWWRDEEYSDAFKAQQEELRREQEEKARSGKAEEEWLALKVQEAKKVAREAA